MRLNIFIATCMMVLSPFGVISYSTATTHLTNTKSIAASKKASAHTSSFTATSAASNSHSSSPTASHASSEVTKTSTPSIPTNTFPSCHCPDSCRPFTSLALRAVDRHKAIHPSKTRIHAVQPQCNCDCSHYKSNGLSLVHDVRIAAGFGIIVTVMNILYNLG